MIIPRLLERRDSCSPSVCSTIAFCSPFPVFRFKYTGASRDTHTHTRDVHTVAHGTSTQSQTANPTTIPTHSNTQTHNELTTDSTHVPQTHGDQTTHRRRSRTTRCQSAATDQGEAAPESEEAAPSEPNPAPSPPAPTEHYNRAPPHVCSKAVAASGFGITIGLTWNRLLSRRADSVSPLAGIGFFLRLGILAPTFV